MNGESMQNVNYYLNQVSQIKNTLHEIMIEASHALNEFYLDPKTWDVSLKKDASPVTTADHHCHQLLTEQLTATGLNIPIISEENTEEETAAFKANPPEVYWLIDPLDGTSGFVKGTGHYAINLALIYNNTPIAGWITWPRTGLLCWAYGFQSFTSGCSSFDVEQPESIEHLVALKKQHPLVIYSSSTQNVRKLKVVESLKPIITDEAIVNLGAAVKFCALFQGYGDVYPRLGSTCLWDLAAGQVLLKARGGDIFRLDGTVMDYDFKSGVINTAFVAVADTKLKELPAIMSALNQVHQQLKLKKD
ncbi:MAG TPA: hypothetical protein DHW71_15095 [Gammaproteobacteria bacterium]|nr:hypothetical protein [Gammaproteobacteria bacterium]HBF07089.1 hypothetical protein [Gammaproteobacteria bacterium]HCK94320.1 hypothetical protein [Gammaproteobacteria bacterium]|tara:strand:- start:376 stop:1290 length:915 start_codon:yes stop_codon:yes gene_type:complete